MLICLLPAIACSSLSTPSVTELSFFDDHSAQCKRLGMVDSTAPDQDHARSDLLKALGATEANAIVFVGARLTDDPETGETTSFTEIGIAYKCRARYLTGMAAGQDPESSETSEKTPHLQEDPP